jgi:pyruvate/2-oxoglutarate dehydrogenase complex dihydrolipoamide acyltransferase (E2) component
MATETTVTLRGEGGVDWGFSLPLSEAIQEQIEKGALQPVDEESVALLDQFMVDGDGDDSVEVVEVKVSAAAAKLAEELGVDLETVEGTGRGGSITKGDVEDAAVDDESDQDGDGDDSVDEVVQTPPAPVEIEVTEAVADLAAELGIDLTDVDGTGQDGEITLADVEDASDEGEQGKAADYSGLNMKELKAELTKRGVEFSAPPGTSKADLVALLEGDDQK